MTPGDITIEAIQDLVKKLKPYSTIYFYDGLYHRIVKSDPAKDPIDWVHEITSAEAEALLLSHEWDLWNIGNPPAKLPETCLGCMYTPWYILIPAGEFLQKVFNLHALQIKESILININKN
jgi:hypothetical protein